MNDNNPYPIVEALYAAAMQGLETPAKASHKVKRRVSPEKRKRLRQLQKAARKAQRK